MGFSKGNTPRVAIGNSSTSAMESTLMEGIDLGAGLRIGAKTMGEISETFGKLGDFLMAVGNEKGKLSKEYMTEQAAIDKQKETMSKDGWSRKEAEDLAIRQNELNKKMRALRINKNVGDDINPSELESSADSMARIRRAGVAKEIMSYDFGVTTKLIDAEIEQEMKSMSKSKDTFGYGGLR